MIVKDEITWDIYRDERMQSTRVVGKLGWRLVAMEISLDPIAGELESAQAMLVDSFNGRGERGVSIPFSYPKKGTDEVSSSSPE